MAAAKNDETVLPLSPRQALLILLGDAETKKEVLMEHPDDRNLLSFITLSEKVSPPIIDDFLGGHKVRLRGQQGHGFTTAATHTIQAIKRSIMCGGISKGDEAGIKNLREMYRQLSVAGTSYSVPAPHAEDMEFTFHPGETFENIALIAKNVTGLLEKMLKEMPRMERKGRVP